MAYNDEFSHITYKNELSSSDDDSNRYKPPSDKRYSYDFNNNNNKVNKYNKWDEREVCIFVKLFFNVLLIKIIYLRQSI